ncbi:OmpA family protein [Vibrio sp. ER1A]|uniref:OmpA family protein n=1 Tax=Vibrio sp. ER1A TaxID=1517681 RepID=UPI00056F1C82|nr:OmpA family protein [Vibrio sp. ER1A]
MINFIIAPLLCLAYFILSSDEVTPTFEEGRKEIGCIDGVFYDSIYFDNDSYEVDLNQETTNKWNELDKSLKLVVVGFTDKIGKAEYNYNLGLKRANYVKEILETKGFSSKSIYSCSVGEKHADYIEDESRRSLLRRVDIYIKYNRGQ